jgi:hypothetical protein
MKPVEAPVIDLNQIEDENVRKNFENILSHLERLGNLNGFGHLEFEVTKAVTNHKIRHGLDHVPKDVIITGSEGAGTVTLNREKFDKKFIDVSTTGAVKVRLFVGTQGV